GRRPGRHDWGDPAGTPGGRGGCRGDAARSQPRRIARRHPVARHEPPTAGQALAGRALLPARRPHGAIFWRRAPCRLGSRRRGAGSSGRRRVRRSRRGRAAHVPPSPGGRPEAVRAIHWRRCRSDASGLECWMPGARPPRPHRPGSQRSAGGRPYRPACRALHLRHHAGTGARGGAADHGAVHARGRRSPAPALRALSALRGGRAVTPIDPGSIRRVLIRATNWIGDAVMVSPAVRALRAHFRGARIAIVAKSWVLETLTGDPFYDDLIEYDSAGAHRGLGGRLRLAAALRRERFDLAVLFQKAFEAAALAFLAAVRYRVGYATDRRSLLLTHALDPPREDTHHVEAFLGIAAGCAFLPGPGRSIKVTGALLESCHLFVRNDSGPMHVAAALGVPTIGIFGPGTPRRTAPIGSRGRVIAVSKDYPCSPCRQK